MILMPFLLALGACGAPTTPDDGGSETPFMAQVSRGGALYGAHCASCHGDAAEGTDAAPRLVGLAEGALPLEPRPEAEVRTGQFITGDTIVEAVLAEVTRESH